MPNWCTNKLTADSLGTIILPYLKKVDKVYDLDFNKIVPMPYGILLTNEIACLSSTDRELTKEEEKYKTEIMKVITKRNKKAYGYETWYDWSQANWGTKWGANSLLGLEDAKIGKGSRGKEKLEDISWIEFQTAWSPAIPIVRALHKITGVEFRLAYYDEGWNFGGVFTINKDGEKDECYEDPRECPEELKDELDAEYHAEMRNESEEE